jgi:hypothetical protein
MVLPGLSLADERFDSKWLTTVSGQGARDAPGYSFRFVSEVKNGNLADPRPEVFGHRHF